MVDYLEIHVYMLASDHDSLIVIVQHRELSLTSSSLLRLYFIIPHP